MDKIVKNIFEIPGEFLRIAKKQIVGPQTTAASPEETQQGISAAAKRKLPGLTANDQKMAKMKISQIRQQILQHAQNKAPTAGPEIKPKQKLPPLAIRNMYSQSGQTGERKLGSGG